MSSAAHKISVHEEDAIVQRITNLVSQLTGNQFGDRQKTMVVTRLRNRMLKLGLSDFAQYEKYFEQNIAEEKQALISLLTTHHTYFFREMSHFEFLQTTGLPQLIAAVRKRGDKTIRVWSAASSGGHEVYSLSMILNQTLSMIAPDIKFSILGSDIDPESVKQAHNGVYHRREVKEIPLSFLSQHWVQGKGDIVEFYKAKKSIREMCQFEVRNLLELNQKSDSEKFDLIFCRNVFIYFNFEQIKSITNEFMKRLSPEGYLVVGKSESLNGLDLKIHSVGPSIYCHTSNVDKAMKSTDSARSTPQAEPRVLQAVSKAQASCPMPKHELPSVIKVFSIDDSPVILNLMKQIFNGQGFEWIGSAVNGKDAIEKLKNLKPDVITLDIHMPEMDGIQYLKAQMNAQHAPVVMVSSVSRDNADLAFQALSLGASDYVEKPALSNLVEKSDELRAKLKTAVWNKKLKTDLTTERKFTQKAVIENPEKYLQLIYLNFSDRDKLRSYLESVPKGYPPTLFVLDGAGESLSTLAKAFEKSATVQMNVNLSVLKANGNYLCDVHGAMEVVSKYKTELISAFVFGRTSEKIRLQIQNKKFGQVCIEEMGPSPEENWKFASDSTPITSFTYLSTDYFSKVKTK